MVDTALTKARNVPRLAALRKVSKQDKGKRPVAFDPRLPAVPRLQAKHWRTMTSRSKYLKEVFPSPPKELSGEG